MSTAFALICPYLNLSHTKKYMKKRYTGKGKYTVDIDGEIPHCTCPDDEVKVEPTLYAEKPFAHKVPLMGYFVCKATGTVSLHPEKSSRARKYMRTFPSSSNTPHMIFSYY